MLTIAFAGLVAILRIATEDDKKENDQDDPFGISTMEQVHVFTSYWGLYQYMYKL